MKGFVAGIAAAALCAGALADEPIVFPAAKVAGTWTLGTKGSPRFQLEKNGTFAFAGWGNSSKGKWTFNGTHVTLEWTHVDGRKVDAGKMRGRYALSADGVLQVDKFSYRKA